jgi:hypothetical protein
VPPGKLAIGEGFTVAVPPGKLAIGEGFTVTVPPGKLAIGEGFTVAVPPGKLAIGEGFAPPRTKFHEQVTVEDVPGGAPGKFADSPCGAEPVMLVCVAVPSITGNGHSST